MKIIFIVSFFFISAALQGQSLYPIYIMDEEGEKKWGFIDEKGKVVIQPQFKDIKPFSEGVAGVMTAEDVWGFIDEKGDWITPAQIEKPKYIARTTANNVYFIDKTFDSRYSYDYFDESEGKQDTIAIWVTEAPYFNSRKKVADLPLQPVQWKENYDSNANILWIEAQIGQWQMVDTTGKLVGKIINTEGEEGWRLPEEKHWGAFSEELSPFFKYEKITDSWQGYDFIIKWGFINQIGEWVIEPVAEEVKSFSEGLAAVKLESKVTFIDKKGNIVIPFRDYFTKSEFTFEFNKQVESLQRQIPNLYKFQNGLAAVLIPTYEAEDKWSGKKLKNIHLAYINKKGEIVWQGQ